MALVPEPMMQPLPYVEGIQPSPSHLWAVPGRRATDIEDAPRCTFQMSTLELVMPIHQVTGRKIIEFELEHICPIRPHPEAAVEAWLTTWADKGGSHESGPLMIGSGSFTGLQSLVAQNVGVAPLLRAQLERFEQALCDRLVEWPAAEPSREGNSTSSGPSAEELEIQLYAVLSYGLFWRDNGAPARAVAAIDHFRQVCMGWIFKLDALYGLSLLCQPERFSSSALLSDGDRSRLSIMNWIPEQITELLQGVFFRPEEKILWQFAKTWWLAGGYSDEENAVKDVFSSLQWDLLCLEDIADLTESETDEPGPNTALLSLLSDMEEFVLTKEKSRIPEGWAAPFPNAGEGAALRRVIQGSSFEMAPRSKSCPLKTYDPEHQLEMALRPESSTLHCWNPAEEPEVIGAARRLIFSTVPMGWPSSHADHNGFFRLDLRVVRGVDSEAAHLFEVGLIANPRVGVRFNPGGPGVELAKEDPGFPPAVMSFWAAPANVMEGVRLAVEVDFQNRTTWVKTVPSTAEISGPQSLGGWLDARNQATRKRMTPADDLDHHLFIEQCEYLHERLESGDLDKTIKDQVLTADDVGEMHAFVATKGRPEVDAEQYHFFIVVPTGMEIEVF